MRPLLIVIISLAVMSMSFTTVVEADEVTDMVNGYLNALTSGDTILLKAYIGGQFYNSRKSLLEKNADYSEFLRDFYKSSKFRIVNVEPDDRNPDDKRVTVEFLFSGGNISRTALVVSMDSSGEWKIIDEEN